MLVLGTEEGGLKTEKMTGKTFKKPQSSQGCRSAVDNRHESRMIMYILTARKQTILYVKLIEHYVSRILDRVYF
jgi:hypothetical protein